MAAHSQWRNICTPLDHSHDQIRLLEVDMAMGRHTLRTASLDNASLRYTALSYPWGDWEPAKINVNGFNLWVSGNLQRALEDVILFWKGFDEGGQNALLLWCDQVCIDQDNVAERNHQVAFMGKIYSRAERVLIWLPISGSIATDEERWSAWMERHLNLADGWSQQHDMAHRASTSTEVASTMLQECIHAWERVRSLAWSEWWIRAWAYQEFILARDASFLISGMVAPWKDLHVVLQSYVDLVPSHILRTRSQADRRALQREELYARAAKRRTRAQTVQKRLQVSSSANDHQGASQEGSHDTVNERISTLLEAAAAIESQAQHATEQLQQLTAHAESMVDATVKLEQAHFVLSSKATCQGPMLLSDILSRAGTFRCGDTRDLVYAFLGLVEDHGIRTDYSSSNTVDDVLADAVRDIMRREKSLSILLQATDLEVLGPSLHGHQQMYTLDSRCKASAGLEAIVTESVLQPDEPQFRPDLDVWIAKGFQIDLVSTTKQSAKSDMLHTVLIHKLWSQPGVQVVPESTYVDRWYSKGDETETTDRTSPEDYWNLLDRDEVWILFGLDLPVILDPKGRFLCFAMLWEGSQPSAIVQGAIVDAWERGEVTLHDVRVQGMISTFVQRWRSRKRLNGLETAEAPCNMCPPGLCDRKLPFCGACEAAERRSKCEYFRWYSRYSSMRSHRSGRALDDFESPEQQSFNVEPELDLEECER